MYADLGDDEANKALYNYCVSHNYKCTDNTGIFTSKTINITSLQNGFNGNQNIKSVDLRDIITNNVSYIIYAFNGCTNLTTINLSENNLSNIKDNLNNLFNNCNKLTKIYFGKNFNTSNKGIIL
jgi:hypothetical protein